MPLNLTAADRGIQDRATAPDAAISDSRATAATTTAPPSQPVPVALSPGDRAVVDEVLLRGGSVEDALRVLVARALPRNEHGLPLINAPVDPGTVAARQPAARRVSVEAGPAQVPVPETFQTRVLREIDDSLSLAQFGRSRWLPSSPVAQHRQLAETTVGSMAPLVLDRYRAHVAQAHREFEGLANFVRVSFAPISEPPYVDPFASADEKYRAVRAAFYRAGWPFLKRDILDHIQPASFFGVRIIGGLHVAMANVLAAVEAAIGTRFAALDQVLRRSAAASLKIGGFVPRFQAGSNVLSNHAFGLAIDADATWNPQIKTAAAVRAFKRATGEDMDRLLLNVSAVDGLRRLYERAARASAKLKVWLDEWIPKYDQLQSERATLSADPTKKARVAALDRELRDNPDLRALQTLIAEYRRPAIDQWRIYGILTIPPEVVQNFVTLGRSRGATWGGEYGESKDFMHLELMPTSTITSPGPATRPQRIPPRKGFGDLLDPAVVPVIVNGPP